MIYFTAQKRRQVHLLWTGDGLCPSELPQDDKWRKLHSPHKNQAKETYRNPWEQRADPSDQKHLLGHPAGDVVNSIDRWPTGRNRMIFKHFIWELQTRSIIYTFFLYLSNGFFVFVNPYLFYHIIKPPVTLEGGNFKSMITSAGFPR